MNVREEKTMDALLDEVLQGLMNTLKGDSKVDLKKEFKDLEKAFAELAPDLDLKKEFADVFSALNTLSPNKQAVTDKEITYQVVIPGYDKKDVKVSLKGDTIITSVRKNDIQPFTVVNIQKLVKKEALDLNALTAKLSNGILYVTIPKKDVPVEKDIDIEIS